MFDYKKAEIGAGAFLLLGLAALAYLSLSIGGLTLRPRDGYRLRARFSNVGDLKLRAPVKVAGVTIGRVESIGLVDYYAEVELEIDRTVQLPADSIQFRFHRRHRFLRIHPVFKDVQVFKTPF